MTHTEEKPVQVLLRLLPAEVKKFDALARRLKATSRNHAMSVLLDSIEDAQAAKVDVNLPEEVAIDEEDKVPA